MFYWGQVHIILTILKCPTLRHLVYLHSCITTTSTTLQNTVFTPRKHTYPLGRPLSDPHSHLQPLAAINVLSNSRDLPVLDTSCECHQIIGCLCAWLLSLISFVELIHDVIICISTVFLITMHNVPVYRYTFCLSIHLSVDIWVISTFWIFWIELIGTCVCCYLFEYLFLAHWNDL